LLVSFLDCIASSLIQYNLPLFTSHFVKEQWSSSFRNNLELYSKLLLNNNHLNR